MDDQSGRFDPPMDRADDELRHAETACASGNMPAPPPQPEMPAHDQTRGPAHDTDLAVRIVEAALFASTEPVTPRALSALLAPLDRTDIEALVARVAARHEGSGLCVQPVAGGWQFRTATDLAPYLTQVQKRPRRLPRATMETLAIIAYHQPCTRTEIEEIRGVSLAQTVLETLIEAELITPCGRKEVPGRPTLWGTSTHFLERFGLGALRDLPRREELVVEMPGVAMRAPELALSESADLANTAAPA